MMFYPSPMFIALGAQRLGVNQVRPDGRTTEDRVSPVGSTRPVAAGHRWRFRFLRAGAA